MNENAKAVPEGPPPNLQVLEERVRQGTTVPADAQPLRLRLEISGGSAGEHYHFDFSAHESGEIEASLHDELRHVHRELRRAEPAREQVERLFRSIDVTGLAEAARLREPIPPCSLVGQLTVSDGRQFISVIYMADPEQAKEAGFRIHPAVQAVVGEIHQIVARQFDLKAEP